MINKRKEMNKKALLKAVLLVLGVIGYTALLLWAGSTGNQLFLALVGGPPIVVGLFGVGKVAYDYFKEFDS